MMDFEIFKLVGKLGPLAGPVAVAALVGGLLAWHGRGLLVERDSLAAHIARLDSTTVKRDTFDLVVRQIQGDLSYLRTGQDAMNKLLMRSICRTQPTILCSSPR